ncbi:MAG: hypothetical protein JW889_04690 [Verrucomicrobia bacterium]|nr:hypothetical protein [Verrucomicrobiota bacterium]
MKRTGILVALIAVVVLVLPLITPRQADAASRTARARNVKDKDDEDKNVVTTPRSVSRPANTGNVRSGGNVNSTRTTTPTVTRSSSSSERTNTGSRPRAIRTSTSNSSSALQSVTRRTTPTVTRNSSIAPRVTRTTSPSVTRLRASETHPTATHTVQPTVGTARSVSTRTNPRIPDDSGRHPGIWRHEPRTITKTEDNVTVGRGTRLTNSTPWRKSVALAPVRRRDLVKDRDGHDRHDGDHHDGDHHHRDRRDHDRRRVFYYNRWIYDDDYYYCNRLIPPWGRTEIIYVVEPVVRTEVIEHVIVVTPEQPQPQAPRLYEAYLTRQEVGDPVVTAPLPLTAAEYRRVQTLIARGLIAGVLKEGDVFHQNSYTLNELPATLTLTAPSERIAIIETAVRDERTFRALTEPNRYGYSATVVALASPYFLQEDFEGGVRLAAANFDGVRRMLEQRDRNYATYGKESWLNSEYGTATIVDDTEALASVGALVTLQPFIPVEFVVEE